MHKAQVVIRTFYAERDPKDNAIVIRGRQIEEKIVNQQNLLNDPKLCDEEMLRSILERAWPLRKQPITQDIESSLHDLLIKKIRIRVIDVHLLPDNERTYQVFLE